MTRYELFKKRIAPALFLGMVGLIAYDSCDQHERTHATIEIDLGAAEPRVRGIRADLVVGGDVIGTFERRALSGLQIGCPCKFEAAMPDDTGELRLEVDIDGVRKPLTKKLYATEGAKITVALERDLLR